MPVVMKMIRMVDIQKSKEHHNKEIEEKIPFQKNSKKIPHKRNGQRPILAQKDV